MLVTVAICTWNRAGVLDQTLHRMRSLRLPPGADWELLVVNNNCSDHTDAVADSHAGHLPVRRLFEPRAGISYARNCAIKHARGDYLLWIDDDAWPDPDWVERMLEAFDTFGADLVIGKVVPEWAAGKPPPWFVHEFNGMFALLDFGGPPRVLTDARQVGHNVNMGFRRDLPTRIGGYREDIGVGRGGGAEDIDLCGRAYQRGLTVAYQPLAVVHHVIPAARGTKTFLRKYTWNGAPHHLAMLRDDPAWVPRLLGLPRYFIRRHGSYFLQWAAALTQRDAGRALYYELKFLRLIALWRRVLADRLEEWATQAPPTRVVTVDAPTPRPAAPVEPLRERVVSHV
jgi:glycosyltransferase involved in cell wall biosynthesis